MNLSASSLWRAEPCAASAVLPREKREYADAERGRKEHRTLEASPPPGSIPEIAFAYNVLTGRAREVGRSIGRNYGKLEEGEIPGTADLVTVADDHLLVTDYKTGVGYLQAEPPVNVQLQHNALSAALVFDRPLAIVQLIYTKTGEVKDAEFDVFAFAMIRARLSSIFERCRQVEELLGMGAEPQQLVHLGLVKVGDQCWRCPALKACPLKGRKAA